MLAQILHDLYVPRELLDGLSEDHRQLLFCKMREEQVRRYHEREEEEEEEENEQQKLTKIHSKTKKKQVKFLLGADGKEWCWIMGESEKSSKINHDKNNNENLEITHENQSRNILSRNYTSPIKSRNYYTTYRDERKQIEEISNNIQEARRVFERLESDTRQLALSKESEILQQQKSRPSLPQNEIIDEQFYREVEERAKKADRERREIARRARNNFQQNSLQLNVCFDTDNHTTLVFQPPSLNSTKKIINEKEICIELMDKKLLQMPTTVEDYRSKPLLPLTRDDIRRWFCTYEIPYGTFRSPNGQIYPWFHGIISRAYSEQILASKPIGTYLIRINEKIFGYALSYRASDHCRHLLIEVVCSINQDDNRGEQQQQQQQHAYRFLGGAKYESFTQLVQLIEKYSNNPIRSNSSDVLRFPCGQIDPQKADYADLFVENDKQYESLYISLETTTSSPQTTTHL